MSDQAHTLRKGVTGGVGIYVAMVVSLLGGFFSSVLLVRYLSQEAFGVYRLFVSLVAVGSLALSLGVDKALIRIGAELHSSGNHRGYLALMRGLLAIRSATLAMMVALVFLLRDEIGSLLNLPAFAFDWLPVAGMALFVFSVSSLWGQAFLATRLDQAHESVGQIAMQVTLLAGLAAAASLHLGFGAVVIAWLSAYCVALAYYTVINFRWLAALGPRRHDGAGIEASVWRRVAAFSATSYVGIFLTSFRDLSVDNLLLSYFLDTQTVAIYALAGSLVLLVSRLNPASILRTVVTVLMVSRLTASREPNQLCGLHMSVNKLVIFVTLPLYLLLMILGDEVIRHVFSPEYVAGYPVLLILSACFFIGGFEYTYLPLIYSLEKLRMLLVGGLLGIVNVALSVALIPHFGMTGAAMATGGIAILAIAVNWWYFRVKLRMPLRFPWKVLFKCAANLSPAVVVALLARDWVSGPVSLVAVIAVCGASYLAMSYFNKVFEQKERDMFNQAIGRPLLVF
jgi:O-antigen/teichoic acid export membrane protein